jgi:hypothetical protein
MVTEDEDEDEILQQDNVVQHKANKTFETNWDLKFERLEHYSYSLDFVCRDFHMSGPLKDAFMGAHVSNDEEVTNAVHSWLSTQYRNIFFLTSGITKLFERWNMCIEKWWDCIATGRILYVYVTYFVLWLFTDWLS